MIYDPDVSRLLSGRIVRMFRHTIWVPYPVSILVEQYFDFEHIQYVHARSLGQILLETVGNHWVVGEIRWPVLGGLVVRSRIRQRFRPPDRITWEMLGGFGNGSVYDARFIPEGGGTRVEEYLLVPGILGWLAGVFRAYVDAKLHQVWVEDLRVKMCRGGWPGIQAVGIRPEEIVSTDSEVKQS